MSRRLLVAALVAGVAVVLGADSLVEAWSAWLAGEPMSEVSLWGRDMRAWGRFGKGCIFLAGMSVVLDLIDPETLAKRGQAAQRTVDQALASAEAARLERRQARERFTKSDDQQAEWLLGLAGQVNDTIIDVSFVVTTPWTASRFANLCWSWERAEGIAALVQADDRFDEGSLRELHATLLGGYDRCTQSPTCLRSSRTSDRDVCDACEAHVADVVEDYVAPRLSDEDRALLRRRQEVIDRTRRLDAWLLGLFFVGTISGIVLVGVALSTGARWLLAPAGAAGVTGIAAIVSSVALPARHHLALLLEAKALAVRPKVAIYSAVAAVLDKARPAHVLRQVAFGLFVIGSHFDLLST